MESSAETKTFSTSSSLPEGTSEQVVNLLESVVHFHTVKATEVYCKDYLSDGEYELEDTSESSDGKSNQSFRVLDELANTSEPSDGKSDQTFPSSDELANTTEPSVKKPSQRSDELVNTIEPNTQRPSLNVNQLLASEHHTDLSEPISRKELEDWEVLFLSKFRCYTYAENPDYDRGHFRWAMTGAYRRGLPSSSEINLLVMGENVDKVFNLLRDYRVGRFSPPFPPMEEEENFLSGLIRKDSKSPVRRINICSCTRSEWSFRLLCTTGPTGFLQLLEARALTLGFKLDLRDEVKNIKVGDIREEKELFNILELRYVPPTERTDDMKDLPRMGKDIPKLLALLKKRKEANAKNPDQMLLEIEIEGADLEGLILNGENLSGAKLSGANLSHSDLRETTLARANLEGANFTEANLSQKESFLHLRGVATYGNRALRNANLTGVNFTNAKLTGVNLYSANLTNANLTGADFTDANFTQVTIRGANFTRTMIKGAINVNLLPEQRQQANPALTKREQADFDIMDTKRRKEILVQQNPELYLKALLVSSYADHHRFWDNMEKNVLDEKWVIDTMSTRLPDLFVRTNYYQGFLGEACERGKYDGGQDKDLQPFYAEVAPYLYGENTSGEIRTKMINLFDKLDNLYFKL